MRRHPSVCSGITWMVGLLLLTCLVKCQSIEPRFEQYRFAVPTCAFQDKFGFLWVGTQVGLYRYDGYRFKRYTPAYDDSNSISSLWVTAIDEDRQGNLWIGTYGGGLNHYDQTTDRFVRYTSKETITGGKSSDFINAVTTDDDGSVWLGTKDQGVIHMNLDPGGIPRFKRYNCAGDAPHSSSSGENFVLALHKDRKGYLWAGTMRGGLKRIDPATGDIRHFRHDSRNSHSLSHNTVSSICEDESGNLWIGTGDLAIPDGGGVNLFDRKTERFRRFTHDDSDPGSLPTDRIGSLLIDRSGTLWIGTIGNGVVTAPVRTLSDAAKPSFTIYETLRGGILTSLYEDRLGDVWIATFGSFLYKHDHFQNPFIHYRRRWGEQNTMSSSGVQSVTFDRSGNLWFGLYFTGLDKYDTRTGRFTHYRHRPDDPHSIGADCVNGICEDDSGYLWLATNGGGLNRLDTRTGIVERITRRQGDPSGLSSNFLRGILLRHNGDLWVASQNQVLQLYERTQKRFFMIDLKPRNREGADIVSLCEDRSGILWVGTLGEGIFRVRMENERPVEVKQFVHTTGDRKSLTCEGVSDIIRPTIVDTNALWIATDLGLNRLDLKTETFTHVLERDGLASDFILKVLEDARGNIWCCTEQDISMYDIKSGAITNYGLNEGLPSIDFGGARQNAARGSDGQLVFSGASGSVGFYPDRLRRDMRIPPVYVMDIRIFNKSLDLDTATPFIRELTLSHYQHALTFEFAALSYTSPGKNQYAYMLEGFQDTWTYCGSERTASFTNLAPGSYVFRVKGSNSQGAWNETGASIAITITPPWWRSIWAYAAYVLLAVGTLVGAWRLQTRRLRNRHELELRRVEAQKMRELDTLKSSFFANISHEFRTPLTLILGPVSQLLARAQSEPDRHDLGIMERSARRLQRLINQLLDLSSIEAGKLKLQARPLDLVRYMRRIIATFESHAKLRRIDLSFAAVRDRIDAYIDPEKFEHVMYNLLTNAFKYTPDGGKVEVRVALEGDRRDGSGSPGDPAHVEISVSDTGIGIPPESRDKIFSRFYQVEEPQARELGGTGIGLALVKEIVDLHHGSVSVESHVSGGTTFRVRLLLGRNHFGPDEIAECVARREGDQGAVGEVPDLPQARSDTVRVGPEPRGRHAAVVLVVEDNPDMRAYLTGSLRQSYRVITGADGEEGLRRAIEEIPDLVISDIMMPRIDGFELCGRLKKDDRTSHIPVILLTARTTSKDKLEGLERGADDYLMKPFDVEELKARAANLISLRRALRERFLRERRLLQEGAPLVSLDDQFLGKVLGVVQQHLKDDQFGVEPLARMVGFSVSQLERKLEGITGQRPNELIRSVRLERARLLLERRAGTISEVAFDVGFNNLSYFARSYKKQFGFPPSETPQ